MKLLANASNTNKIKKFDWGEKPFEFDENHHLVTIHVSVRTYMYVIMLLFFNERFNCKVAYISCILIFLLSS